MSWQRYVHILLIGLIEAIPPSIVLIIFGSSNPLIAILLIVLLSCLIQTQIDRFIPATQQRIASIILGLVAAAWLAKIQVGAGYNPLSGWSRGFSQLFDSESGVGYLSFLAGLYASYRGTNLLNHDSYSLRAFFQRCLITLMLLIGVTSLLQITDFSELPVLTVLLLCFFAGSLFAISLATAAEHDSQLKRLGWRAWLPMLFAICGIMIISLVVATFFAADLINVITTIFQGIVTVILIILSPFMYLIGWIIEWLASIVGVPQAQEVGETVYGAAEAWNAESAGPLVLPDSVKRTLQIIGALIPVLLIAILYLFSKRRKLAPPNTDEERESLWDWSNLQDDLLGLFKRRENERQQLQERLKQLQGDEPHVRVRRAYVQWLLLGLQRKQARASTQTPREYQQHVQQRDPKNSQPVATLTSAYEQARYGRSVAPSEAEQAEQAWKQLRDS